MNRPITNMNTTTALTPGAADAAAEVLAGHPDFRVLRRISSAADLALPVLDDDEPLQIGAVVDVETSGLDSKRDVVIELAIQRFKFDRLGRIVKVDRPRSWLQEPGFPLDPRISKTTGLSDQDLGGQAIDDEAATDLLRSVEYVVAHNCGFDRKFVEARLPGATGLKWACSMSNVNWHEVGFEGRCGSAPKQDPALMRRRRLKLLKKAILGGVPIGADRDPA